MSAQDNGGPAFPVMAYAEASGTVRYHAAGMTLRDYFAAKAMASMIATQAFVDGSWPLSDIADQAFTAADEMLIARLAK